MKLNYPRRSPVDIVEQDIKDGRSPDADLLAKIIEDGQATPIILAHLADKARTGGKASSARRGRPKKRQTLSELVIPTLLKKVIIEHPGITRKDALTKVGQRVDKHKNEYGARKWKSIEAYMIKEHGKNFWADYKHMYWRPKKKIP